MDQQNGDSNAGGPLDNKRTALQRSLSTSRDDVAAAHTDASIRSKSFEQVNRSGSWHRRKSSSKVPAEADVAAPAESSTNGVDGTTAAAAANHLGHQNSISATPSDGSKLTMDTLIAAPSSTAWPGTRLHHSSRSSQHEAGHAPLTIVTAADSDVVQEQTVQSDLLLAGEAVVPSPAPAAAEAVITEAVQHTPPSVDPTPQQTAAADQVRHAAAEATNAAATSLSPVADSTISSSNTDGSKVIKQKASTKTDSSLGSPAWASSSNSSNSSNSSSSSSRSPALPLPALVALGIAAAAAAAGAVVFWRKHRGQGSKAGVPAAEDDEFTRALKEMDEEEKAFEKQAKAKQDPAEAELSAEEAALAMQQADAARREKQIAAALDEGDAELAKIDALDSADLENLSADELAALEAELAELEGGDVQEILGETAS